MGNQQTRDEVSERPEDRRGGSRDEHGRGSISERYLGRRGRLHGRGEPSMASRLGAALPISSLEAVEDFKHPVHEVAAVVGPHRRPEGWVLVDRDDQLSKVVDHLRDGRIDRRLVRYGGVVADQQLVVECVLLDVRYPGDLPRSRYHL